jgi:hypothetical protein
MATEALAIDRAWVLASLKENALRALQAVPVDDRGRLYKYDGNVANRALELLGKELGMFIDRSEVRTGNLDALTRDERDAVLAAIDQELAFRRARSH